MGPLPKRSNSPHGTDAEISLVHSAPAQSIDMEDERCEDIKSHGGAGVVVTTTIRHQVDPNGLGIDSSKEDEDGQYRYPRRPPTFGISRSEVMSVSRPKITGGTQRNDG